MTDRRRPSTHAWTAVIVSFLIVGSLAGCASRTVVAAPPATPAVPARNAPTPHALAAPPPSPSAPDPAPAGAAEPAANATDGIAAELDVLFGAPTLRTAVISALVQSLDSGEVLYRQNPDTLVVPASNMKIVTMAVAAARLGWDYRFETRLEALTSPVGGVLRGDLFVVGTGDPTVNARAGDPLAAYRTWAEQLEAAGITRITGRVVGDDDAFEDERFGEGWSWDDFAYGYAAPVGALQFNENTVELAVKPGGHVGAPAFVELRPAGSDLVLGDVQVTTAAAGAPTDIDVERFPGNAALHVHGVIAVNAGESRSRVAVNNPTLYAVTILRDVLRGEGIAVDGGAVDIDETPDRQALKSSRGQRVVLERHFSPTLAEIGRTLMKVSQNLYAETVFRTLALEPGPAGVTTARERAVETLRGWGLAPGQYALADGSGLSRLNLASATMIVRILQVMARDPALSAAFEATLPIAGRDGTLSGRMKATRAEANAVGKTGSLSSVRSLSGYVRTADGERLVFAFLVNNFLAPSSVVDLVVDQAVERLANLRR